MSIPPPSFASGSALPLPDPEAYEGEPREYARALMQRKDEIEAEIVSPVGGARQPADTPRLR